MAGSQGPNPWAKLPAPAGLSSEELHNPPVAVHPDALAGSEPVGRVATKLGTQLSPGRVERFLDGELRPVVEHVRGADGYVIAPTGPPVNEQVVELLLVLDACRRSGAARVTAVVPYFGYARLDRRSQAGEAVGARMIAEALAPLVPTARISSLAGCH
ncbi:MAG: ribose-phosphate pyrophosphokinase-like domain-containing protein [Pseudonocardiaceae bacterium]